MYKDNISLHYFSGNKLVSIVLFCDEITEVTKIRANCKLHTIRERTLIWRNFCKIIERGHVENIKNILLLACADLVLFRKVDAIYVMFSFLAFSQYYIDIPINFKYHKICVVLNFFCKTSKNLKELLERQNYILPFTWNTRYTLINADQTKTYCLQMMSPNNVWWNGN